MAAKRRSFWFKDEDDQAFTCLVQTLKRQSPVRVTQIEALRWAIRRANEELAKKKSRDTE